jgi:hypothetical protein
MEREPLEQQFRSMKIIRDLLSGFGISKESNLHASNIYWSKIVL